MDYKNKYLKYKNKYLNLKGGGLLEDILKKHGITDLNTEIPGDLVNELNQFFKLTTWKNLLNTQDSSNMNNIIDTYFNMPKSTKSEEIIPLKSQVIPRIPEVIIPTVSLPDSFSDIYNLANGYLGAIKSERTPIKMTHILFKKKNDQYNVYGLYYHDHNIQDLIQIEMLQMLIKKRYTRLIQYKTNQNFPEEEIEPYRKTLTDVLNSDFWKTSKFFILGSLIFDKSVSTIRITHFDAWNLVKTSGLKMLCTILWLFKNVENLKISLKPGTVEVFNKFYKPLGFKDEKTEVCLDDIKNLIKPCEELSDDNIVKLILTNNNNFINSSDDMIKLIN